jgi:hypothetical protein
MGDADSVHTFVLCHVPVLSTTLLLLVTTIKSLVPDEERTSLVSCISMPARSELMTVTGFPSATAASPPRSEARRPHTRSRPRARSVTIRHAQWDQVRVEPLDLDAQILQPHPVRYYQLS